jgi:hypothetical protein
MSIIHPECFGSGRADESLATDVLLREEPDEEEEDDEDDEEKGDDDDDGDMGDGYSE